MSEETELKVDVARRFGGVARLYGEAALARFVAAHVCVIGIGGVGSWAAEALARSAIGRISLIDLDHIAESNVNRQIHALEGEFGRAKVHSMAARIRAINPLCQVTEIEEFVSEENVGSVLPQCDAVIDAIDNVRAKAALISHCKSIDRFIVTTGAAGGRRNPALKVGDLATTQHDRLAARLRARLRQQYGFSRDPKQTFDVECVFSPEPVALPLSAEVACGIDEHELVEVQAGLNCAGYGSSVNVTATFGLVAAARILERLARA
jgi:tRNA A37 threonylcarbamoyladenosine dehydratase